MSKPYRLKFSNGETAVAWDLADRDELPGALRELEPPRPVLVLVGGADSLDPAAAQRIAPMFGSELAPLLARTGAVVIDGGTNSGVMALVGQARAASSPQFPLIGVAARGTVHIPDTPTPIPEATPLEPNHTHFLLVPGNRWGDESPWIFAAASALAHGAPSLTLVAGGGRVTRTDLELSLQAGKPTLLVAGSGGLADDFADALRTGRLGRLGIDTERARLLRAVEPSDAGAVAGELLRVENPG